MVGAATVLLLCALLAFSVPTFGLSSPSPPSAATARAAVSPQAVLVFAGCFGCLMGGVLGASVLHYLREYLP